MATAFIFEGLVIDIEAMVAGQKDDAGKPRWDLIPWEELADVVDVLTVGARKYADDNWKKVPNAWSRYFRAGISHAVKGFLHVLRDEESAKSHFAHAICCFLFLAWYEKHPRKD